MNRGILSCLLIFAMGDCVNALDMRIGGRVFVLLEWKYWVVSTEVYYLRKFMRKKPIGFVG